MRPQTLKGRGTAPRSSTHDRWLVSYADFITLLFAFFTVMSTVNASRLTSAAPPLPHAAVAPAATPTPPPAPAESIGNVDDVRRRLSTELADAVASGRLEISVDGRGLVLSLPDAATFATGSTEIQPDARLLVARLGATLQPLENAIRIEGHTDDVPIHTPSYGSNWELSTARASAVVAFLIGTAGLQPARLSAAGYGEFHPRVPNDSIANRTRNRRVDIIVLRADASGNQPAVTP